MDPPTRKAQPPLFFTTSQPGMTHNPQAPPPGELQISEVFQYSDMKNLLTIEAMMVVGIAISFVLVFGSLRKRTSNFFVKRGLWAAMVSAPLLISYCVGKMTSNDSGSSILKNKLFLIWWLVLFTGLASYGTISAFELEDNETAVVAYMQGLLKIGFAYGLVMGFGGAQIPSNMKHALFGMVPLILYILMFRVFSLTFASKTNLSHGVGQKVKIVAEFMEWDVRKTNQVEEAAADPKTMEGYRYLVGMNNLMDKAYYRSAATYHREFETETESIVTTQEIWQCEGELLSPSGGDPEGRLKDTCLSFALFWMLLRRYTGYSLPEVTSLGEKTWKFVRYGLIPDISPPNTERAFRVIEQELSFVYDYFYTKNFVLYLYGNYFMCLRFFSVVLLSFSAEYVMKYRMNSVSVKISKDLPSIYLEVIITNVVIYAMIMSEVILMVHYLVISQWSRVRLVCAYVRKQHWRNQTWKDACLRWAIEYICHTSLHTNFKHWRREIDQYSLVHSHDYIHPIYYIKYTLLPHILDIPKRGRKASKSIPFSMKLKTAILSSLHTNGRILTNGKTSLRKYGVESDFSWACDLEGHTQTILVWHIATSFCELNHHNRYPGNTKPDYLLVPTSLSKYCAYLVAFTPELLPDHPNTTLEIIKMVIDQANIMFKGCSNMEDKYETMREVSRITQMSLMSQPTPDQCESLKDLLILNGIQLGTSLVDEMSLVSQLTPDRYQNLKDVLILKGIQLGKSLVDKMSDDSDDCTLWAMLGEFWAELLLYLAPSDDAASHIKHLANGGHLITHLWTLLTHAGILTRD